MIFLRKEQEPGYIIVMIIQKEKVSDPAILFLYYNIANHPYSRQGGLALFRKKNEKNFCEGQCLVIKVLSDPNRKLQLRFFEKHSLCFGRRKLIFLDTARDFWIGVMEEVRGGKRGDYQSPWRIDRRKNHNHGRRYVL